MTSYNTVYKTMEGLAEQEANVVHKLGKDATLVKFKVVDNVQHYVNQRDARVGRENHMNVGIAGTYIEAPTCPVVALDLDDKRRRLAENKRASLTVDQLLGFIDMEHRETVGVLQWLRVLTSYVPQLSTLQEDVSEAYRTRGKKLALPATAAKVHPLATSGKNETVTTELKDALLDFMGQTGQLPSDYNRQLMLIAGDGLTFEKIVLLKNYMQFHDDSFESFELVQPVLAPWHTVWADLCRIVSTWYGSQVSKDPSTLGYGAVKIGRRQPSSLKKPDFKEASDIVFLTLDARIIDCFRCVDYHIDYQVCSSYAYFSGYTTVQTISPTTSRH